ncbi:TolC family outer membrane protein [Castellaniella daejeonensis]|uniref:TolC family outer membrane protein n=1 Tax=Castellaniella daejeonensis TaxID=659013 RepID=A0ABN0TGK3_9BURK|nr:TolC family outer membrane protein [Castellaniella sp.]HET8703883.1 TolC family outer membrane protein [Castellaniella sp.]
MTFAKASRPLVAGLLLLVAGSAGAMNLREAVDRARVHDPTLEAARFAYAAGQESARQGTALYLPQITATGTYSHVHVNSVSTLQGRRSQPSLVGDASGFVRGFTVTLTQPIYNAAVSTGARQLKDQARLAEIQFRGARQNQVLSVAQSYFGVLMAKENLELAHEQQAAIMQQLASAQARFNVGKANITDVRDAQARAQAVAAQIIAAENALEVQRQQFKSLVGTLPADLSQASPGFKPVAPDPDDVQAWIERGRSDNLNVLGARVQISIAEADVDKNQIYNRPQLDLYMSYQDASQSGGLPLLVMPDRSRQTVIGLQLNVPLFAGGSYDSKLRQAIDQKRQADAQLQAAMLTSDVQIREQFQAVEVAVPQIEALEKAVIAAKSALDATLLGATVGERTTLDVLNAQQQYFSARQNLDAARYQYLLSRLNLAALVGALGEPDVDGVDHYLSVRQRPGRAGRSR